MTERKMAYWVNYFPLIIGNPLYISYIHYKNRIDKIIVMKICVISDIHGSTLWEDIVRKEKEQVDRFVFLGDYVDDKKKLSTAEEQIENLLNILDFKEEYEHVDLLIGNHDLQYIGGARSKDFDRQLFAPMQEILMDAIHDQTIQVCVCYDKYLFSHAGVSKIWMKEQGLMSYDAINKRFQHNPLSVDFVYKTNNDPSGDDLYQSPLWIRPDSLIQSMDESHCQVVGHSRIKEIFVNEQDNKKIIFTDNELKGYVVVESNDKDAITIKDML